MFTVTRTISRLTQVSLIGAAIAVIGISTAAEAKSPMRWTQHSVNKVVAKAPNARTSARSLPKNLKSGIQNLSKADLRNVRVNRTSKSAGKLGAKGFAKGTRIHLAPGQMKHLPHEAWHVTQQKNGRVVSQGSRSMKSLKSANRLSKTRRAVKAGKTARNLRNSHRMAKVARHAKTANNVRKGVRTANTARKVGRAAMVGTGVGAVVVGAGILAGAAGVDPVDMAMLKATNPAEYNRRMTALKKNPVKYMGNNLKNNTVKTANNVKKAGKAVGTVGKKAGCGIGNVFKKKNNRKKC